jgi:HK97 family phage major capsid protein
MTSKVSTVQELEDARATQLNIIDDIFRSAKADGRAMTDAERVTHDAAVAAIEDPETGLNSQIARATVVEGDAAREQAHTVRRARFDVPNVNVRSSVGAGVTRSLDSLLWATADKVPTGNGALNPVEQVVVRSEELGQGVLAPRITEFRGEDRGVIRSFQSTVAEMAIFGLALDKHAKSSGEGFQVARGHRLYKDRWNNIMRALDTDTSAEGTEWIPTGIGASIHEQVRAAGKVAPLFQRINIPTNPWKLPIEAGDATAYRYAEPTSDTATKVTVSTPGTGAATFDAEIFGARVLFSKSLDADSIVAILPFTTAKLVRAFVDAEEKAILDGDTDGTHQDSDVGASTTDARTAWDGLRKKALAQTLVTATSTSVANLFALRAGMGKWGVNPADLAYIIGVSAFHDLIADSNLLTVDKMGPNATILNGMIGSLGGVPVIVSEHVRENLNATGVYDGITTTKTYNLCVNRNEWVMGQRTALDVEVDDSIYRETYQRVVVGFMREDFQSVASAATNEDTAMSYNVTP